MGRTKKTCFVLVIAFLSSCEMNGGKPEKVLDLRKVVEFKECPVHHVPLQEGVEPIEYGHISSTFHYYEARNKLFPLAFTGDITDYEAKSALVIYCPDCREAKKLWAKEELEKEGRTE